MAERRPTDSPLPPLRLTARVASLELAVLALARAEFGDRYGHAFRGNQWGVPAGEDIVVRREDEDNSTVVRDHTTKLGTIERIGGWSGLDDPHEKSYEATPKGGRAKAFEDPNEAVRHILKATAAGRVAS